MQQMQFLITATLLLSLAFISAASADDTGNTNEDMLVNITRSLSSLDVQHNGKTVTIQREQDTANRMNPDFTLTSRKCPPFCIQPSIISPGVETIAELEVLEYLKRRAGGDDSVLVIDSRGPKWIAMGTIPGSINIHYKKLSINADEDGMAEIIEKQFGAERLSKLWDFSDARTLVFFCNGMWCGQSPRNIRSLLKIGYPPEKIKWYRGGMQAWETMGLTTIKPEM